ncbi:uracil-DNA glycosylase [bacterium]|nr:uracil-DNA glycosylase [bacterium]
MNDIGFNKLANEIKNCNRCSLYETRTNALPGEGNHKARIMLVAQAPGETEDVEGRMFIGPSGKILDELLYGVGIDRNEIYMTNLIKCMLPKYRNPKEDEIKTCSRYLDREIELIDPEVIAPMGFYASKYICDKYKIPTPGDKTEMKTMYGKLYWSGTRKILPLTHPVALLFKEELKDNMLKNYGKLKTMMTDCKWYPVCPIKFYYEKGKIDGKWVELYCKGDWKDCVRYWKEERGEYHQDWMLPDGTIDETLR